MPKTPKSRIPSPARSQGPPVTPRRYPPRSSRSLASPARSSPGRPSSLAERFKEKQKDSFALSPLGKSVLGDNTEIDMPRRASWWRKLDNSRDVVEVLDAEKPVNQNVLEEFEVEVLTQETKNYTIDMPDSSDSESISSIVVPQRKLFTQKDNAPQKKFDQVIGNRESMAKNKTHAEDNIELSGTKNIFKQPTKKEKPKFPSALLNISPDKTLANKTKELVAEVKGQARNLFGNRMGAKRKNMFADFVVSESEDEIPDIQPKLFTFKNAEQQKPATSRRSSNTSRGFREPSPATSITTDIELDDWKLLPSSTMVEHQLEADLITPRKKTRLSKLSEAKESTAATNSTKQSNKSVTSKNKSKSIIEDETEPRKHYSTRNNSKLNASASKRDTIVDEEIKEASNVKNRTYAINKTVTKSLSQSQNVENKDAAMNEEKGPQNVEPREEEDEEMHLTYEENDQVNDEVGDKETSQKSVNKNQSVQSKDLERSKQDEKNESQKDQSLKDKDFDDIESRLADIVGQGEAEIGETETPEQDKSVHLPNKVINETADSEIVQKEDNNEVSLNENENLENSQIENGEQMNDESQEVLTSQNNSKLSNVEEGNEDEEENDEVDANGQDQAEESDQENAEATDQEAEVSDERTEADQELESDAEQEENDEEEQSEQEVDGQQSEQEDEMQQSDQEVEADEQVEQESEQEDEQVDDEVEHDESNPNDENEEIEGTEELSQDNIENQDEEEVAVAQDQASDDDEQVENDEDTEQEQNESQQEESFNNEQNESQEMYENEVIEESEEIEESNDKDTEIAHEAETNESHDTTGRNRQKRQTQSPEAILHDVTNEMDSFLAKRRNTSIRKTILKKLSIRPSMAPPRESTGISDGSNNSSAQGSGWDSHRTTRKTLRQTFGKDFTPRKSLRALVMEKSAKQTMNEANVAKLHQANSTEMEPLDNQDMDFDDHVDSVQSDHEVSTRTRQATLEMYLQKINKENMERKLKIEEQVKNSLKSNTIRDTFSTHFAMSKPTIRRAFKKPQAPKLKRKKPTIIEFEDLPPELMEDMKYKPPKRFRPSNASWITNRLYKFLEGKLEPKYDYRARVRAEKLVEDIYNFSKDLRKHKVAPTHSIAALKKEMARLDIVRTHFEFYNFIREYLPLEIKIKVVPDIVNDIPMPSGGVYAPILA